MIDTILLDMDGVLTDFERSAVELGCYLGNYQVDWEPIWADGDHFWVEMHWTADGKQFYDWIDEFCKERSIKLGILSAVQPKGMNGKKLWLAKNTRIPEENWFIVESGIKKAQYAKENVLLIDDFDRNLTAFQAAGGKGLLYKTFEDVKSQLIALLG